MCSVRIGCAALLLGICSAGHAQQVQFIPATAAHGHAVRAYQAIWEEFGTAIVASLESRTCLRFPESKVAAIVADATSNSGGPDHPMRLRATYAAEVKRSTLVHELGHRHLWQLEERLDELDGHQTLFLILDRVWEDVWGADFAERRILDESAWQANYDYAAAWHWARTLDDDERARLWRELLALNGRTQACGTLND